MKFILALLCLLFSFMSYAGKTGVGLSLGNPTGINGKYWLEGNRAIDGGLGWSFGRHTNFSLHSDYLFHNDEALFFNEDYPLDLYYGIGARMEFADEIELGVRLPIGLAHKLQAKQADVFSEIAPIIDLVSKTGLEIHFLFGARYYF